MEAWTSSWSVSIVSIQSEKPYPVLDERNPLSASLNLSGAGGGAGGRTPSSGIHPSASLRFTGLRASLSCSLVVATSTFSVERVVLDRVGTAGGDGFNNRFLQTSHPPRVNPLPFAAPNGTARGIA
jgi:hypothetical protein